MKNFITVACLLLAGHIASASCIPQNNLGLYDGMNPKAMKEEEFNEIIDHIIKMWEPLAKLHGATLVAEKKWKDPTVNAYATQKGNVWSVTMFGGLARRPEITPDGFALVVCHELGHHFAGHYFYNNDPWAASEGQSDYFATQVCGRKVFERATGYNLRFRNLTDVPPVVKEKCSLIWKTGPQVDLCYRLAAAGHSLATLLAAAGQEPKMPSFQTPDQHKVTKTFVDHPASQCRLDTYFQASLCNSPFDYRIIPAKDMGPKGNNSPQAEIIASKVSCFLQTGYQLGARPECWFHTQNH